MVVANDDSVDTDAMDPTADAGGRTASKAPSRPAGGFTHLKTRAEFLRAAKGARFHTDGFSLQATPNVRPQDPPHALPAGEPVARFGFTVTKKTAGAVGRNRIRRRLREATRIAALSARPGYDYVLVARQRAADAPFTQLVADLVRALDGVHRRYGGSRRRDPSGAEADKAAPAMSVRLTDAVAVTRLRGQSDETNPVMDFGKDQ